MKKLTSRSNQVCVHLKKLGKSKKYREEKNQFLCDGEKLLKEAIYAQADIDIILTTKPIDYNLPDRTQIYRVSNEIINSISPLINPQGVLFSCNMKKPAKTNYTEGIHIMLDRIQDPGNVGTIIRCSDAFSIKSVILTGSSADIYNPKTLRGSMGGIFRQELSVLSTKEIFELKKQNVTFIGASNNNDSMDIREVDLSDAIIILGNEGQGISKELFDICDIKMKIPLLPECESINVAAAAAIIMWESLKRR